LPQAYSFRAEIAKGGNGGTSLPTEKRAETLQPFDIDFKEWFLNFFVRAAQNQLFFFRVG